MQDAIDKLLHDYIALYTKEHLPRWRELFVPAFVASARNEDGSITSWNLETFYERQRGLFATGRPISEVLSDVEIRRDGSLACVKCRFTWTDGEVERNGRLMMLVIAEGDRPKVQSLTFSYHG